MTFWEKQERYWSQSTVNVLLISYKDDSLKAVCEKLAIHKLNCYAFGLNIIWSDLKSWL